MLYELAELMASNEPTTALTAGGKGSRMIACGNCCRF
jgi:hypothetical protein